MADQSVDTARPLRAKPYGWIGLPLSLILIVVATFGLVGITIAAAFGIEVAILGWAKASERATALISAQQSDGKAGEFGALCFSLLLYGAMVLAVTGAARLRGGRYWPDLVGWHPWSPLHASRWFWIVGGITLAYSLAASEALNAYYPAAKEWVTLPSGAAAIGLFFVLAAVAAPAAEELLFRGWLYTALKAKLGVWPGILIASILFALAHWESTHLYALVVFPVGVALGMVRERSGSLRASMTFHAIYNTVAFGLVCIGR